MSYEYDPNNYRIRRTSALQNSVTEYAYDNNGSVTYQKETVGTNVTTRSYAYFDGKIIGFYINDKKYYTVTDMLGTVVDVYAEDGTEVWTMDYTSFGMKGGETVGKIQLDAMFTGKDMDSETGLTYHWNRWRGEEGYNWISEDSARDGTNWYGYAGQNPLIYLDPNGLEPGDLFSSPDLAAKDFGLNYNDDSIRKNIEIGTFIRKINGQYTYDIPHEGDETSVDFIYKKNDISIIAKAHTHGAYKNSTTKSENDLNETRALEPSKKDIDSVKESGISLYTFTPDGSMYLNCNENGKVENYQYPSIFPSDINCPERKNDVNANNLPNNQTISKQEYINQR